MLDTTKLKHAIRRFKDQFEPVDSVYLGRYISDEGDGYHTVDILRPDGVIGERRKVRGRMRAWPGVIVRLSIDRKRFGPEELVIMGADEGGYGSTQAPSALELHGEDHGHWQIDQIPNLHTLQIWPLRVQPHSGLTVRVMSGLYYSEGAYRYLSDETDIDLTGHVPGDVGRGIYATISIDSAGSITVTEGTETGYPPQVEDIAAAPIGEYALSAVLLRNGDTTITQDRVVCDLRYITGSPSAVEWGNVIIVAKSGGEFDTVTAGLASALANEVVWVLPGNYSENITFSTALVSLRGFGLQHQRGPVGVYIVGGNDVGPMMTWTHGGPVVSLLFYRVVSTASDYVLVDASTHTSNPIITDCRLDAGNLGAAEVISIKIKSDTDGRISRCYLVAGTAGNETAIEFHGGPTTVTDTTVFGDLIAQVASDVILRNCYIDGDVTGTGGATLILQSTYISGMVSGWDSVTYLDDSPQYLLATGARAGATSGAQDFGANGIKLEAIEFDGISAANIITVPDDIADALSIEDGGTLEYLRINSDDDHPYLLLFPSGGGKVGMGTPDPIGNLHLSDTGNPHFYGDAYSTNISEHQSFISRKSHSDTRGTVTETIDNEILGSFTFKGVNSAPAFVTGAFIKAQQDGAAGADHIPAELVFYTSDGTAAIQQQMVIDKYGNVVVGATAALGKVHVDNVGTIAQPVLLLDQGDVSEEMIEFATTIGVGNAIEAVNGKTLTTTHFIKVTLPGPLTRYIPVGTIA